MIDRDKLMEEIEEDLCNYCPWTNFGETVGGAVSGLQNCEGCSCSEALDNYIEEHELIDDKSTK